MENLQITHVKLLAFHLHSLSQSPSSGDSFSFPTPTSPLFVSRAEIVGIITSRDHKPNKFLKFTLDDATGCVTCLLWLNHLNSPYFSRRNPPDVRLIAHVANRFASDIQIGAVGRVRGRITRYRGAVQITVSDVVIETDPNAEILHWLECLRLSRHFYHLLSPPHPPS